MLLLSSTCVAITFLLYLTFRPSDLPVLVYGCFPVAGATMFLTTSIFLDAVMAKRAADEVLGNLQSRTGHYYSRLALNERKEIVWRIVRNPPFLGDLELEWLLPKLGIQIWNVECTNSLTGLDCGMGFYFSERRIVEW